MHGQALCAGTYIYTWGELEVSINRVRRDGEGKTSQVCAPPPQGRVVFSKERKNPRQRHGRKSWGLRRAAALAGWADVCLCNLRGARQARGMGSTGFGSGMESISCGGAEC